MEHESFPHMIHEHPLSLIPESSRKRSYEYWCCGCWRSFIPGDATYGCSLGCGFEELLHKECMEMPREIMHPLHPSHPLSLEIFSGRKKCAVCGWLIQYLGYRCSQGGCDGFWIHLGCAAGFLTDKQPLMYHPSHPHQLRFSKKMIFYCDACGSTEKGNSYICTLCDYCMHESCALLPLSMEFPHHHPAHSLSLAFSLPSEYIKFKFDCAICSLTLPLRRWVYNCHLCRYVVHLNCATSTFDDGNANAIDDAKEVAKFPMAKDDVYEEMIRPFVKRQRGQTIIPHDNDNHNIGGKYRFFGHPDHLLTYTTFSSTSSSSASHDHYKIDDDEDDCESIPRSELICDGCTLAIHEKKQTDDDDEYENGYMSCDECKYFIHLSCFNLPLDITSLPIHPLKDHNLRLRNVDGKLTGWIFCDICYIYTNGLYYTCTICSFKIDIKCASLPNTIKHASHPRHNYLKLVIEDDFRPGLCVNCHQPVLFWQKEQYRCNSCRVSVCGPCVMLPATNKHRLENHLLSLTYDACVNRPGDFYCSSCEYKMHPRLWMYHCRDCDQSFHPKCFPATSGEYRNIKFGTNPYVISSIHDHPLRFQIINNKKRCDLCHRDTYDEPGFQCASCFFAVCLRCCVKRLVDA